MRFSTLDDLAVAVAAAGTKPRVVAAPCAEPKVLNALLDAAERGLATPVLVGDMDATADIVAREGRTLDGVMTEHVTDPAKAVQRAVELIRIGEADVLMKGLVNTDVLLRVVLKRDTGLPTRGILSHVAAFALPGQHRLTLLTDAGVNVRPNFQRKLEIVRNGVDVARGLGIATPRVAMLAATEKVMLPAMPATLDAAMVSRMAEQGEFGDDVTVAGPMALDVAISPEAAASKGCADHPVAGRADILCAPDIEAGNVLYKAITTLAKVDMAGIVAGTSVPLVVPSRGDTARSKYLSIAMACYLALGRRA